MSLLARLEAKRREVDRRVRDAVYRNSYDFEAADLRDLFDDTIAGLKWRNAARAVIIETTNG